MNKIINILAFIVMAITGCNNCPDPTRPDNLSLSYRWIGGCDGGVWIQYEMSDKIINAEIYSETGSFLSSSSYSLHDSIPINETADFQIISYVGTAIVIESKKDNKQYQIFE